MIRNSLYFFFGIVFLGLAYFGIILPGVPAIPFILLSGWMFLNSSPTFYNWMLRQRFIGPVLKKFYSGEGVSNKMRWFVISQLWVSLIIAQLIFPLSSEMMVLINFCGVLGSILIYRLIKTKSETNSKL